MQLSHDEAVADVWTAQFLVQLARIDDPEVCTTAPFLDFAQDAAKQPRRSPLRSHSLCITVSSTGVSISGGVSTWRICIAF